MKQRREAGLLLPPGRSAANLPLLSMDGTDEHSTVSTTPLSRDIQRNIISSTHSALHTYKAGEVMENGGLSTALRLLTTCMLTTTATML